MRDDGQAHRGRALLREYNLQPAGRRGPSQSCTAQALPSASRLYFMVARVQLTGNIAPGTTVFPTSGLCWRQQPEGCADQCKRPAISTNTGISRDTVKDGKRLRSFKLHVSWSVLQAVQAVFHSYSLAKTANSSVRLTSMAESAPAKAAVPPTWMSACRMLCAWVFRSTASKAGDSWFQIFRTSMHLPQQCLPLTFLMVNDQVKAWHHSTRPMSQRPPECDSRQQLTRGGLRATPAPRWHAPLSSAAPALQVCQTLHTKKCR